MQASTPDVVKLREFKAHENANLYLEAGWVLVATHTWDYGHPVNKHQKTVYCLGWPRAAGELIEPEIDSIIEERF